MIVSAIVVAGVYAIGFAALVHTTRSFGFSARIQIAALVAFAIASIVWIARS